MKKHRFALLPVLVLFLSAAYGQSDTTALEEVSITVLPFREKFREATGGVFICRSDEIRREHALVSTGVINTAPGVLMSSGALNTSRVVIRGIGSRTPYGSNRIRAYLDDIPLTSGDGISTLEDQDPLAIGSMEVLKGPSSAIYGSGLGGIIRLNSPYPQMSGWNTSLMAEAGSYGSQRYGITGSLKKGALALSAGFTRTGSAGFRENSEYRRNSAFLHARYFGRHHRLSMTLSLTDLFAEIPSSLSEEDFLNDPGQAGGNWADIGGYEEYLKLIGGIRLESDLGTSLTNTLVLHSSHGNPYERRPFNILDEASSGIGLRDFLEYKAGSLSLGAGVEFFHEGYRWKTFETLPTEQGALLSDQEEKRSYLNGFAYFQWRPSEKILVDAGLNLNLLEYRISTLFRQDSLDQGGSYRYSPVLSPRMGISFRHGKHLRSYASAGHGFSAPSLEETLLPEGLVNTSLRPESGWNVELGNRGLWADERLSYDITLYSILLKDLLVTERLAEDIFTGVNAGSAWNRGLEASVKGRLNDPGEKPYNVGLQLAYHLSKNTFTDFVDDGVDYSGLILPGIPRQLLRIELYGELKGFSLVYKHIFTGQQWMDDSNDKLYGAYNLDHLQLGWSAGLAAGIRLRFYGGIRNILNTQYASMILINAPAFGGRPPRYYYPGTPRYYYLGIALELDHHISVWQ